MEMGPQQEGHLTVGLATNRNPAKALVMVIKLVASGVCACGFVQALRIGLFAASGWGLLPLGFVALFSLASLGLAPGALAMVAIRRRWVMVEKTTQVVALAVIGAGVAAVTFFLNSRTLPGFELFMLGFEAKMQRTLSTSGLLTWADAKLRDTMGLQREQSIRLKEDEIPSALLEFRKSSKPTAQLVFGSEEKRWVFLIVKWREAFGEWGVVFTCRRDAGFEGASRFRKLQPGVYAFYE